MRSIDVASNGRSATCRACSIKFDAPAERIDSWALVLRWVAQHHDECSATPTPAPVRAEAMR